MKNKSTYRNQPLKYPLSSLQNAKEAALKEQEETDISNYHANHQNHYDYIPIVEENFDDKKFSLINIDELIDEASKESFPASDPPAWINNKYGRRTT